MVEGALALPYNRARFVQIVTKAYVQHQRPESWITIIMQQRLRKEVQRRQVYIRRLAMAQSGITLLLVLLAMMSSGKSGVMSSLLGVMVALIPHATFVARAGVLSHRLRASQSAKRLLGAEMGKFGLTVVLFITVFIVVPPQTPLYSLVLM
ncbi:ATP synthase subunit I [Vreelandella azerica]|uniref:ATP synthase subunit I n=1 Tax=Vreelandella azerica TaxID=2732867 RepID=UPI001F174E9A|nr:ATP synthase subunit I [Halomonas azerica]